MTHPLERLWSPQGRTPQLQSFLDFVRDRALADPAPADADALWRRTVADPAAFWTAVWDFFDLPARADGPVITGQMPNARWFEGSQLSFAQQVLAAPIADDQTPALIGLDEAGARHEISWAQLRDDVRHLAGTLRALGVEPGDRVVAYLPNLTHAVIALLATASLGAIWSAVGHDYAPQAVIDRFDQLTPKVLIAADGYHWAGRVIDRRADAVTVADQIATIDHLITIDHIGFDTPWPEPASDTTRLTWAEALTGDPVDPIDVEFNTPLWVLFSSGTTGIPKGIVQSQGGITLDQTKLHGLQIDMLPGERIFWYTSPSWMMWNLIVCGMLRGVTVVCYEGHPIHPGVERMWQIAQDERVDFVGLSPGYLDACVKAGLNLSSYELPMRALCSTGAPLSATTQTWFSRELAKATGRAIPVWSVSGGTDICSGFCGATPLHDLYAGFMPTPWLGVALDCWDADGNPVRGDVGELVITQPMPSMPIHFWNDPDGARYRESYFDTYPGVWRHGDWISLHDAGIIIHGRSDSTLNRNGVRIGSAEIYRVVEALPEVVESLVIGAEMPDGSYWMPLFLHLADGVELTEELRMRIRAAIREHASPRHVPGEFHVVRALPHTKTGKRVEVPVKRILQGADPASVVSPLTLDDPTLLEPFISLAAERRQDTR